MATVTATTSPTLIDDGTAAAVTVRNGGSVLVYIGRDSTGQHALTTVRPGGYARLEPEGAALYEWTITSTASTTVTTTAKQPSSETGQDTTLATLVAAVAALPGVYAPLGDGLVNALIFGE